MSKNHTAANGLVYRIEVGDSIPPSGRRSYVIRFAKERGERWGLPVVGKVFPDGSHWAWSPFIEGKGYVERYPDAGYRRSDAIDALAEHVLASNPDEPWVIWPR